MSYISSKLLIPNFTNLVRSITSQKKESKNVMYFLFASIGYMSGGSESTGIRTELLMPIDAEIKV